MLEILDKLLGRNPTGGKNRLPSKKGTVLESLEGTVVMLDTDRPFWHGRIIHVRGNEGHNGRNGHQEDLTSQPQPAPQPKV